MHQFRVRRMEEKDIQQITAIEEMVFSDPWSAKSFEKAITDEMDIYLAASDEKGSILGYCGLWGVAGEGQITNVAVHPGYRRIGVGKQMFQCLLEYGRAAQLNAFTLEVRVSNIGAIHLYQKFGFEKTAIRKNFYSNPTEDAIIMWLYDSES